jgi:hypothetical protein
MNVYLILAMHGTMGVLRVPAFEAYFCRFSRDSPNTIVYSFLRFLRMCIAVRVCCVELFEMHNQYLHLSYRTITE